MNYEEMVKMAYEDIVEGFEKEASTALTRYVAKNPETKLLAFPPSTRQEDAIGDLVGVHGAGRLNSKAIARDPALKPMFELYNDGANYIKRKAKNTLSGKKGLSLFQNTVNAATKITAKKPEDLLNNLEFAKKINDFYKGRR